MNDTRECRPCCRGTAPYFICRDKECLCHLEAHLKAVRDRTQPPHKDPTAQRAVNNVMRGRNN